MRLLVAVARRRSGSDAECCVSYPDRNGRIACSGYSGSDNLVEAEVEAFSDYCTKDVQQFLTEMIGYGD